MERLGSDIPEQLIFPLTIGLALWDLHKYMQQPQPDIAKVMSLLEMIEALDPRAAMDKVRPLSCIHSRQWPRTR